MWVIWEPRYDGMHQRSVHIVSTQMEDKKHTNDSDQELQKKAETISCLTYFPINDEKGQGWWTLDILCLRLNWSQEIMQLIIWRWEKWSLNLSLIKVNSNRIQLNILLYN